MWIFGWKGPSGFSASSTAEEVTQGIDGTGLTAIVAGASSGIGVETTRGPALRGVHLVMAVRNVDAGRNVKEAILKEIPGAKIDVMELDLSPMASLRKFASEYQSSNLPLNLLINNAGVLSTPFMLSHDNIELQFATNHLGHFLLTNLLLETIKNTARESNREGRIVNLSSQGHRLVYREGIRFDKINDESGNWSINQPLVLLEEGVEITANSLHPGAIMTNLMHHLGFINSIGHMVGKYFLKNIPQGAATTCYVALHPQVKGVGEYFLDSNIGNPSSKAKDADLAKGYGISA
ncbi:hypothetical protein CRYUN_Cryun13aG0118000 [Craigia yunnanensis]